jgi:hypothetical protein
VRVDGHQTTAIVGAASAVTVMLVWIAGLLGLLVPPKVGSAFTTIVATVILFFIGRVLERRSPHRSRGLVGVGEGRIS